MEKKLRAFFRFLGSEAKPVALIPMNEKGYQIIDLQERKVEVVDQKIDDALALQSYMFYRSLPEVKKIKTSQLIKFSLKNQQRALFGALIWGLLGVLNALFLPFITKLIFTDVIPYSNSSLLLELLVGYFIIALASSHLYFGKGNYHFTLSSACRT